MTLNELIEKSDLKVLTTTETDGKEVSDCYVCDLLSLAMSRVPEGSAWITVQANVNIVAVAHLTEASCIIIAENMNVESDVIDKANSNGIVILRTEKSAFHMAMEIGALL